MIPRLVHQYWEGDDPPTTSSWDIDGWDWHLWRPEDLPDWCKFSDQWLDPDSFILPFNNPRARMRSNIARFELLAEFGGVWADTDMELVGDLEDLLVGDCNVARMPHGRIGTSFIATVPHHPFIESCRQFLSNLDHGNSGAPGMLAVEQAPLEGVTLLDPLLVYPNGYWDIDPQGVPTVINNHPRPS